MRIPMDVQVDAHSPIPIRRQLTEQLRHVIEGGGVPPDQALPSIRELAGPPMSSMLDWPIAEETARDRIARGGRR